MGVAPRGSGFSSSRSRVSLGPTATRAANTLVGQLENMPLSTFNESLDQLPEATTFSDLTEDQRNPFPQWFLNQSGSPEGGIAGILQNLAANAVQQEPGLLRTIANPGSTFAGTSPNRNAVAERQEAAAQRATHLGRDIAESARRDLLGHDRGYTAQIADLQRRIEEGRAQQQQGRINAATDLRRTDISHQASLANALASLLPRETRTTGRTGPQIGAPTFQPSKFNTYF